MHASMIDYRYWKMMQLQFLNGWDMLGPHHEYNPHPLSTYFLTQASGKVRRMDGRIDGRPDEQSLL